MACIQKDSKKKACHGKECHSLLVYARAPYVRRQLDVTAQPSNSIPITNDWMIVQSDVY